MSEKHYVLPDDEAAEIWYSLMISHQIGLGNYFRPEHWGGSESLRTFILASIKRRSRTDTLGDMGDLRKFLEDLDIAFRRGPDFLKDHEFSKLIEAWSPVVANPLFDPHRAEWVDKPYFRCQIGSGICQLFVAHAHSINLENIDEWLECMLGYASQMIKLSPIDPQRPGYFHDNINAASAQNYNLAMILKFALDWMKGWDPETIATMSNISKSRAYDIQTALHRRVEEMETYLYE